MKVFCVFNRMISRRQGEREVALMVESKYIEYLVETYADQILRLSYSYLGNIEDAKDVCQTVFIKFVTKDYVFQDQNHEKAFIYRVTANACKDLLRTPWKKRMCALEHCGEITVPETEENDIFWAVEQLDGKYRILIYLYYYEGYKACEIAEILRIPTATVHTRMKRARKKLKKILEESEYERI